MASPITVGLTSTPRHRVSTLLTNQRFGLAAVIVLLFVAFGLINPQFFNQQFVVFPLLRDASVIVVVGLAQMCALSIGQMNLAVGPMAAVGAMAAGATFQFLQFPLALGVVVGLVVGAATGLLTGAVIVWSRVNAFVVTLAMSFALLGLVTIVYTTFAENAAFSAVPPDLAFWRTGSFNDFCIADVCGPRAVPVIVLPAAIVCLLVQYFFGRTARGREVLATGSNFRAAQLSGIQADRSVLIAHTMSGTLAALAGIMLAASTGSFSAAIGSEFLIASFVAPILGGTLLTGGTVSVLGTVFGALVSLIIRAGLLVAGAGFEVLNIALGVVLLVALSLQRIQGIRQVRRGPARTTVDATPEQEEGS
ncbi:MAG: ABC transporter permease [Actinomycetes bacterium]